MELSESAKRMLMPPLIALPIVVGLMLVGMGGVAIADAEGAPPPNTWPMIYVGFAILIANGVFWPLVYTQKGKKRREERVTRRRSGGEEE